MTVPLEDVYQLCSTLLLLLLVAIFASTFLHKVLILELPNLLPYLRNTLMFLTLTKYWMLIKGSLSLTKRVKSGELLCISSSGGVILVSTFGMV